MLFDELGPIVILACPHFFDGIYLVVTCGDMFIMGDGVACI